MAERPQSLLDRALYATFKVCLVAFLLNLAVRLVRPAIPFLVITGIIVVIGISMFAYYRSRW